MHLLVLADERRVRRATDQNYPEGKFICGFNSAFVIKKKKKKKEKGEKGKEERMLAAERGLGLDERGDCQRVYMKRIGG